MDAWSMIWQVLGYGVLVAIVLVLIFAIIEPGPLQKPRTFGRRRLDEQEAPTPSEDDGEAPGPEQDKGA